MLDSVLRGTCKYEERQCWNFFMRKSVSGDFYCFQRNLSFFLNKYFDPFLCSRLTSSVFLVTSGNTPYFGNR